MKDKMVIYLVQFTVMAALFFGMDLLLCWVFGMEDKSWNERFLTAAIFSLLITIYYAWRDKRKENV